MVSSSYVDVYRNASPAMRSIVAAHALGISTAIVLLLYGRNESNPLEFTNGSSFANLVFHAIVVACYVEVTLMAALEVSQRRTTGDKVAFGVVASVAGLLAMFTAFNMVWTVTWMPAWLVAVLTLVCLFLYLWFTWHGDSDGDA